MTPKVVTPKGGPNAGRPTPIIDASFMIADNPEWKGRRIAKAFWLDHGPTGLDAKQLKKLAMVTGVQQEGAETFADWAKKFEGLIPPARFRCYVEKAPDKKTPGATENRLLLLNAREAL
jgi:hypothetical protein